MLRLIEPSALNPALGKRRAKEEGIKTLMRESATMRSCTVSTRSDSPSRQLASCNVAVLGAIACPLECSWIMWPGVKEVPIERERDRESAIVPNTVGPDRVSRHVRQYLGMERGHQGSEGCVGE
jgi:hypothetical protein